MVLLPRGLISEPLLYFNKLRLRGRKQVIYNTSKIVTVISITRRVA